MPIYILHIGRSLFNLQKPIIQAHKLLVNLRFPLLTSEEQKCYDKQRVPLYIGN